MASWLQVQERTFTDWVNDKLCGTDCIVVDLSTDLSDGIILIKLLEILSGKSLGKYCKNPRIPIQKKENLAIAFEFIRSEGIELLSIGPADIFEGNQRLILGLLWKFILHYQMGIGGNSSISAKRALLEYVQNKIPQKNISNFRSDWKDGTAIAVFVDAHAPGLIPDADTMNPNDALQNATRAMQLAEDWLDIPQVITPEDMINSDSDDISMMTYLSQYYNAELREGAPIGNALITPGAMKEWCEEGTIELTLTRVHMIGPPGSGKTCTQHLLLNEDPPKHNARPATEPPPSDLTDSSDHTLTAHDGIEDTPSNPTPSPLPSKSITKSTPIACKAVKALRVSIDDDEVWKTVSRDELIERLASDLKRNKDKLNRQKKKPKPKSPASSEKVPQASVASQNNDAEGAAADNEEQYDSKGILKEIADLIPKAKAQLSDKWVYIVDSGGQPAYQELLPLFTRAASLNIVTIDLSKELNENFEFTYRINGKEFKCDEKMKYSNCRLFKSVISCARVQKQHKQKYVTKPPKHSMYFILGTHYDKLKEKCKESGDNIDDKLDKMNKELMSSLPPHLEDFVVSNEIGKSIIFPLNTLLPAKSEERGQASKNLFKAISRRSEVSLTVKVPIRCFTFELYLENKAESKGFLTKEEAIEEGKKLYMSEDDVEEALTYLHNCTIVLYYPQIEPQLVFVDPQKILDVLSHLLALTYVDDESARSLAEDIEVEERKELKRKGKFKEALLRKFTTVFCAEFQPQYFISLLKHLHIISDFGRDSYFLPSALPAYNDSCSIEIRVKPLQYIWRMENEDDFESEFSVPVPQGIFSLIIVQLLSQKKNEINLPSSDSKIEQYRDAFYLLFKKRFYLHIINRHTHIEVHFNDDHTAKSHCPTIRELVTKAIGDSSEVINVESNHVYAFPCPKKEDCHCIVEEDKEEGMITSCTSTSHTPLVDISHSDDSYWYWFADKMSAMPDQTGSQNPTGKTNDKKQSLNPGLLMKKEPNVYHLLKIFKNNEHQYSLVGIGLEVNTADLLPLSQMTMNNLSTVFERWKTKNKDVTWGKIEKICQDFKDNLGRVQYNLQEYLSSQEAHEEYLKKPDKY